MMKKPNTISLVKYETGSHFITLFSEVGTRIKTEKCESYNDGKQKVDDFESKNPECSGLVARVLYNSKCKKKDKWGYLE